MFKCNRKLTQMCMRIRFPFMKSRFRNSALGMRIRSWKRNYGGYKILKKSAMCKKRKLQEYEDRYRHLIEASDIVYKE